MASKLRDNGPVLARFNGHGQIPMAERLEGELCVDAQLLLEARPTQADCLIRPGQSPVRQEQRLATGTTLGMSPTDRQQLVLKQA